MVDLAGKTAIVTGGSRGIGRAVCFLLAAAGASIVISYNRRHEAANAIIKQLRAGGKQAVAVSGDLSHRENVERVFGRAREAFGKIDIVIGNAGIWKKGPIDQLTDEEWQETVDVNLKSIFYTCQLSAREMKPRRSGRIVLISSTAGQRGEAQYSHYAATKGAIIAMTKSLAAELGPMNIRVNAVAPGWVDTEMSEAVLNDPGQRRLIESGIPLGRIATAEDVAGTILFLASDLSNYVHGEVLNVNGGSVLCG